MLIMILIAAMILGTAALGDSVQDRATRISLAKAGEMYMAC